MSKGSSRLRFTGQEVLAILEEEEEEMCEGIEEDRGMEDIYAPGSDVDLGVDSDKEGDAVGVDSDTEGSDAEEER